MGNRNDNRCGKLFSWVSDLGYLVFFDYQESWIPWISLLIASLAFVCLIVKIFSELITSAVEVYSELDEKGKKEVKQLGGKVGKVIFSLMKEQQGKIGEFCRKWDEHGS